MHILGYSNVHIFLYILIITELENLKPLSTQIFYLKSYGEKRMRHIGNPSCKKAEVPVWRAIY